MPWLSEERYQSIQNYLINSQDKDAGKILIKFVEDIEENRNIEELEEQPDRLKNFDSQSPPNSEKEGWVEKILLYLCLASGTALLLTFAIGIPTGLLFSLRKVTFFVDEYGSDCIKIDNPYSSDSGVERVGVKIQDPNPEPDNNLAKGHSETYCGEGRSLLNKQLPLARYELIFKDIDKNE